MMRARNAFVSWVNWMSWVQEFFSKKEFRPKIPAGPLSCFQVSQKMNELEKTLAAVFFYSVLAGLMMNGLPLYLSSLGLSLQGMGVLFGFAALISGLIKIALSAWTDKTGRKKLTVAASGLTALTAGAFAFASSFMQFAVIKPLYDFSYSFYFSLKNLRVIEISALKDRGRNLSLFYAVFGLAAAIGLLASGFISTALGFQAVFITAGLMGAASLLLALSFKESRAFKRENVHLSLEILKRREGRIFAAMNFLQGASANLVYAFVLPLFLQSAFSLTFEQIGLVIGACFIVWSAALFFMRGKIDNYGALKIAGYCAVLDGVLFFGLSLVSVLPLVIILFLVENAVYSVYPAASGKIASQLPHKNDLGRDVMIFDYFYYFGSAAGLFIAGILASISFQLVFATRAFFMLAIFVLIKKLPLHLEGHEK